MSLSTDNSVRPYELTIDERPGYLYVIVRAETMDRETALAYLAEIADACEQTGCDRIVIERDVPVMLPDGDLFFVTQAFLEVLGHRRVAWVNPHATLEDDIKFAITIVTNRGGNYNLFDKVQDAETWLLH